MRKHVKQRTLNEAYDYVTQPLATIRSIAESSDISKSTVHKDLVYWLPQIPGHDELKEKVKNKIEQNTKERAIRGGEATRKKYLKLK